MIVSFGDKATERLFHGHQGKDIRKFPPDIRKTALRKLDMLNSAHSLKDLRSPPGNRLEALKGRGKGLYSIRINGHWRIAFKWQATDACEVSITDYH